MISDKQPYTYIQAGIRFYAFFENWEHFDEARDKLIKGFHFYVFDQKGYCWEQKHNVAIQYLKLTAHGFFLERPAWEAEGLPLPLPPRSARVVR